MRCGCSEHHTRADQRWSATRWSASGRWRRPPDGESITPIERNEEIMAAIFEAPVGHEGVNPGAFEWEWEFGEGTHLGASPEWEEAGAGGWEWGQPAAGGWASEFEDPASGEWEWEETGVGEWEGEWEGDAVSFGGLLKGIGKVAKGAFPMVAKSLASMVPGVGAIAGPLVGQLAQSLVGEGEALAAEAEAEAFGGSNGEAEI